MAAEKEESIEELVEKKKEITKKIFDCKKEKSKKQTIKNKSNQIIRVSDDFNSELDEIQWGRINKGIEEYPVSKPKLTELIVKHKNWKSIKEDCKNYMFPKNKKGQTTMLIFFGIFLVLFLIIYFFIFGTTMLKINDVLNQNISVGQVNLAQVNADTFGVFAITIMNNADWWGLGTIFGMILGLLLSAYFLRSRFPKISIIFDIFLIISVFIFSLYMRSIYLNLLESLAVAGETFLETYMPNTSKFMINLPIFVSIVGVLMMILNHSSIPSKKEESKQTGGNFSAIGG